MDMPNKTDDNKQQPAGGTDPVSPPVSGPTLPGAGDDSNKSPTDTTVPPVKPPTGTTVPSTTGPTPTDTPDDTGGDVGKTGQ